MNLDFLLNCFQNPAVPSSIIPKSKYALKSRKENRKPKGKKLRGWKMKTLAIISLEESEPIFGTSLNTQRPQRPHKSVYIFFFLLKTWDRAYQKTLTCHVASKFSRFLVDAVMLQQKAR